MARRGFRIDLDSGGMEEVLKTLMRPSVEAAAKAVASNVKVGSVTEAEILTDSYTTDRAAVAVVIAHPAGLALQAKYGSLTKAAAAAGLEVKGEK